MHVSVSAYNDGHLLEACLASVRDVLGDVSVDVVDGRYRTFPGDGDNSTDDTPAVARSYDADYHAEGPFDREEDKWRRRNAIAPDGELCLFLDADERLVRASVDRPVTGPKWIRFHNPRVYREQRELFFYPRLYHPEWVGRYRQTDKPEFVDAVYTGTDRTESVTVAHRHDLRDDAYRRAKLKRYQREDRDGPYGHDESIYLNGRWAVETEACPQCGQRTLHTSPVSAYDGSLSRVQTCTNGECYTGIDSVDLGDYRYLPHDIDTGYDKDPDRLRLELLDAGVTFLTYWHVHDFDRMMVRDLYAEATGAIPRP